jgi:hypothetical protein
MLNECSRSCSANGSVLSPTPKSCRKFSIAIDRRDAIQPAFDPLLGIVDEVLSVDLAATRRGAQAFFISIQTISISVDGTQLGRKSAGTGIDWTRRALPQYSERVLDDHRRLRVRPADRLRKSRNHTDQSALFESVAIQLSFLRPLTCRSPESEDSAASPALQIIRPCCSAYII